MFSATHQDITENKMSAALDVPEVESTADQPAYDVLAIDKALAQVKTALETVKGDAQVHAVETALLLLRQYLKENKVETEGHTVVRIYIVKAHLTKFAFFGWIDDWEPCLQIVNACRDAIAGLLRTAQQTGETIAHEDESVQLAFHLVNECRKSIEFASLRIAIEAGEKALASPVGEVADRRVQLLVLLGNAFVMEYLLYENAKALDNASSKLQDALHLFQDRNPMKYVCLLSLSHIACLRFTECERMEGFDYMMSHWESAMEDDRDGKQFYDVGRSTDNIGEAIACMSASLDLRPYPHPQRPRTLVELAIHHYTRYTETGKGGSEDLASSVSLLREALLLRPVPHPFRSQVLNNLANTLVTQFEESGNFQGLEESISLFQELIGLVPPDHPLLHSALSHMGDALLARFNHKGELRDLEESINLHRKSVALVPAPHPLRVASLINLSISLYSQFKQKGNFHDLEECIALEREVLVLGSRSHLLQQKAAANLANFLYLRFNQKGDFQDLEDSIMMKRRFLAYLPPSHPGRSGSLHNLANTLSTRYEHQKNTQDLLESIQLFREALKLRPSPHPMRHASLSSLAVTLRDQYIQNGDTKALEESIAHYQESLELAPAPHPDAPQILNGLGNSLLMRYKQNSSSDDSRECISSLEDSLLLLPPPHPLRLLTLNSLAHAYLTRFQFQNDKTDIELSISLFKEAAEYESGYLSDRLTSAVEWAEYARRYIPRLALEAYQSAMKILPLLASLDLNLHQRQNVLMRTRNLANNAARCAIEQNHLDTAVVFLSTGRSIFWWQMLQLRAPIHHLTKINPDLAQRFQNISNQLQNASYLSQHNTHILPSESMNSTSIYDLSIQWSQTLKEVRSLEGFEEFIQPPSFDSLKAAACNGPLILLNATEDFGDALILHAKEPVQHVHLPAINDQLLTELVKAVQLLAKGQQIGLVKEAAVNTPQTNQTRSSLDVLWRDLVRDGPARTPSTQSDFQIVLEVLWVAIVKPIVRALQLQKTDSPTRIWWCPTGLFAFLPIHAAGAYGDNGLNTEVECLFDYAISSYCIVPQNLLSMPEDPDTVAAPDLKLVAVIEPEVPGAGPLPNTLNELQEIEMRFPYPKNQLVAHIGLRNAPTSIDTILADIEKSSVAHFGCHGVQLVNNPLESYMLLSSGKLTIERIIRGCRTQQMSLAYLSACETATADLGRPNESLNLAATMLSAGFRGVVGTMWSIQDEDAPQVAKVFYSHLFRKGTTEPPSVTDAACGLHLAVQELRRLGRPFRDWVPFVHFGI